MSTIKMPATIILNQRNLGPSSTNAANGGIIDLLPWHKWDWADELTFYITVSAINGTPSGGQLTAKFQLGTPYVSGNQFSTKALFDLDAFQKGFMIAEGEDWSNPVAAYNASVPFTVSRTIRDFGSICNLRLDASSLTGGTNPTFTITVAMSAKGN